MSKVLNLKPKLLSQLLNTVVASSIDYGCDMWELTKFKELGMHFVPFLSSLV